MYIEKTHSVPPYHLVCPSHLQHGLQMEVFWKIFLLESVTSL